MQLNFIPCACARARRRRRRRERIRSEIIAGYLRIGYNYCNNLVTTDTVISALFADTRSSAAVRLRLDDDTLFAEKTLSMLAGGGWERGGERERSRHR